MFVNNTFVQYLPLLKLRHNRFIENVNRKEFEGVSVNSI